jgi:hypothetical protein
MKFKIESEQPIQGHDTELLNEKQKGDNKNETETDSTFF